MVYKGVGIFVGTNRIELAMCTRNRSEYVASADFEDGELLDAIAEVREYAQQVTGTVIQKVAVAIHRDFDVDEQVVVDFAAELGLDVVHISRWEMSEEETEIVLEELNVEYDENALLPCAVAAAASAKRFIDIAKNTGHRLRSKGLTTTTTDEGTGGGDDGGDAEIVGVEELF